MIVIRLTIACMMQRWALFEGIPRGRRKNLAKIQEAVRRAVRAEARQIWGKKPVTTVFVTRI